MEPSRLIDAKLAQVRCIRVVVAGPRRNPRNLDGDRLPPVPLWRAAAWSLATQWGDHLSYGIAPIDFFMHDDLPGVLREMRAEDAATTTDTAKPCVAASVAAARKPRQGHGRHPRRVRCIV